MTARLTRREWIVWACYVSGMTVAQIAESNAVQHGTAKSYLKVIRRKLGIKGGGRFAFDGSPDHA